MKLSTVTRGRVKDTELIRPLKDRRVGISPI